jgi:hypothetical protein
MCLAGCPVGLDHNTSPFDKLLILFFHGEKYAAAIFSFNMLS